MMPNVRRRPANANYSKSVDEDALAAVVQQFDCLRAMMPDEENWLTFKKQLLLMLPPKLRENFSIRVQTTRAYRGHPPFNAFEVELLKLWHAGGGRVLRMPPEKMLQGELPESYVWTSEIDIADE